MSLRAQNIAAELLDINEDLESKMPLLVKQFPELGQDMIRELADSDPTSPGKADYTTFLCRMFRKNGTLGGSSDEIRKLLTDYDAVKKKPRFLKVGGNTDINAYDDIKLLRQHVEAALKADFDEAVAKKGTKGLNKVGDLMLFRIFNFEAARKIAIEPGSPAPENADFRALVRNAGGHQPGWPWASWCTQLPGNYPSYADGPIYVVKKGNYPYVQISFKHEQAHDIFNVDITAEVAAEIGPLFAVSEFSGMFVETMDEAKVAQECGRMIEAYISRHMRGTVNKQGVKTPPTVQTREEAKAKLRPLTPKIYQMYLDVFNNWDTPMSAKDTEIIAAVKSKPIRTNKNGVGTEALRYQMSLLPELKTRVTPPFLASVEDFVKFYHPIFQRA